MLEIIKIDRFVNANLIMNKHDDKKDTIFLIFPGGNYESLNNYEMNPVSLLLFDNGYDTAILKYTTKIANKDKILNECDATLNYLSRYYKNIILIGFGSGGHLAGIIGTANIYKTIKAMVLGYPVVSLLQFPQKETINNFLKNDISFSQKELYSVEKRIDEDTIPTFVFAYQNDKDINLNHTLLLVKELQNNKINHDYQIYKGKNKKNNYDYLKDVLSFIKKLGL